MAVKVLPEMVYDVVDLEVDEIVAVDDVVVVVQVDVLEVLVLLELVVLLVDVVDVFVVVDDVEEIVLVGVDAVVEEFVDEV